MDRGRRAEPYSNATIWTREIARNLAGHLSRVSKAHSCVDTKSPKSTRLPRFNHTSAQKRCPTSPMKTRQSILATAQLSNSTRERELDFRSLGGSSSREETENTSGRPMDNARNSPFPQGELKHDFTTRSSMGTLFQIQTDRNTSEGADANQEIQDRPDTIPAIKSSSKRHHIVASNATLNDKAYDCPPILPQHRTAHDYYKRQEQKKIWLENQAFIKRLQSTKATLNSKEWKKDEKWTQEFLKNQEKRRSALQHELRRAQVLPHAILRSKPLKSLPPHHLKSAHHESRPNNNIKTTCSPTDTDVASALRSQQSLRRGSKGKIIAGSREALTPYASPASAANHRRIMELRQQTPDATSLRSTTPTTTESAERNSQPGFIPDNEVVQVRFTFSRGRSRGSDGTTRDTGQCGQPQALETGGRDMMSLSGAFSPGVELESALNAVAANECEFADEPTNRLNAGDTEDDAFSADAQQIKLDRKADGSPEDVLDDATALGNALQEVSPPDPNQRYDSQTKEAVIAICGAVVVAVDDCPHESSLAEFEQCQDLKHREPEHENPDVEVTGPPLHNQERYPLPEQEEDEFANKPEEQDEAYDEENFDDDHEGHPKENKEGEVAFKEETTVSAIPDTGTLTSNNDECAPDEEEEYSNDDFDTSKYWESNTYKLPVLRTELRDAVMAESLGHRTPERPQAGDEIVTTCSRQLDFGGDDVDVIAVAAGSELVLQTEPSGENERPARDDAEEGARVEDVTSVLPAKERRRTVFWSADEEDFLRQGVAKYGAGKWKKILLDGQLVFAPHRTNVDLKDKWKNLQAPRATSRKRRRAPGAKDATSEDAVANATVIPARMAKKSTPSLDETSELSSLESIRVRPRRRAAVRAKRTMASIAAEQAARRGTVELRVGTDKSFPELVPVTIDLDACQNVLSLKKHLYPSLLSHATADADIQVIGLKARMLFEDEEKLSSCIDHNGTDFYLVAEESPEEFV